MSKFKKYLVIGATGTVGRGFMGYCQTHCLPCLGTYHSKKMGDLIQFDLEKTDFSEINGHEFSHAIIAAGITNVDACYVDQKKSELINVTSIQKVIGFLQKKGIFPIFLSSDYVFDGAHGNYVEDDSTNPTTVYGRQKLTIETFLRKSQSEYLILRLGKVISDQHSLGGFLSHWYQCIQAGKSINAAQDQITAFVSINDTVDCIHRLVESESKGTYHISNGRGLSKLQLAELLVDNLHRPSNIIQRCSLKDLGLKEKRPLDTSLDSRKVQSELGISFKTTPQMIREFCELSPRYLEMK